MNGPGRDSACVLPDGRRLEYWDGGDPDGRGVVFHPGTPATRILGRWGHDAAVAAGVRLVAVSRQGYGGSENGAIGLRATGRDTADLACALGLSEYAVFGVSGGGPFAAATAAVDAGAVRAVGIVAGVGPWRLLDEPTEDDVDERGYLALLDDGDVQGAIEGYRESVRTELEPLVPLDDDARVDAFLADSTGPLTQDAGYRALWAANLDVVLPHQDGWVLDQLAWGGTWDVDLHEIGAPALVWYGEQDTGCPPAVGQWYADHIDRSQLRVLAGEGHLDVCDSHWPEVLGELLQMWPVPGS